MILDEEALSRSQNLEYSSGTITVLIPFVCFRCGKCCRKLSVGLAPFDIHRIAEFLRLNIKDFIIKYLGEITSEEDGEMRYKLTKPSKPCPFLSYSNMCTVYEVRPLACRSFPLETDFGDSGIGCQGYKQVKKVMNALGQGVPYFVGTSSKNKPIQSQWKRIYKKFLRAEPSDEMKQAFIRINNIPMELIV